ncbi:hypothetical protein [Cryptosporangium sp. NPDC048952]|uniref:hypothetical protein n=1 Tax=Cryptosporangium sp. NPDC048952 TaxID=3363961 RepID=UPI00371DB955
MSDMIVVAVFTTRHFSFLALGTSDTDAMTAARATWLKHCGQYDADPQAFDTFSITLYGGLPGAGFCDDAQLTGPPGGAVRSDEPSDRHGPGAGGPELEIGSERPGPRAGRRDPGSADAYRPDAGR